MLLQQRREASSTFRSTAEYHPLLSYNIIPSYDDPFVISKNIYNVSIVKCCTFVQSNDGHESQKLGNLTCVNYTIPESVVSLDLMSASHLLYRPQLNRYQLEMVHYGHTCILLQKNYESAWGLI